jgi:hypothetical protein
MCCRHVAGVVLHLSSCARREVQEAIQCVDVVWRTSNATRSDQHEHVEMHTPEAPLPFILVGVTDLDLKICNTIVCSAGKPNMHSSVRACTWHVFGRRGKTNCPTQMTAGWFVFWRVLIIEDNWYDEATG